MREPESIFVESGFLRSLSKGVQLLGNSPSLSFSAKTLSLGKWLVGAIVFSCLFLPRFSVGAIAGAYQVDLRLEDLLLGAVAFLALMGEPVSTKGTGAVERAFAGFLLVAALSILNGFFLRTIDKPLMSLLYLFKWVEYFCVFALTAQLAGRNPASPFWLRTFFLLGLFTAGYGYWEYFFPASKAVYPNYYRLFERWPFHGDANHVGGFLVIWLGCAAGLFLTAEKRTEAILLFLAILFVFFPLIGTYSRKSYFALAGVLLFSFLFPSVRKRAIFLACVLALLGTVLPLRLPERLLDLGEAFASADPFHSSWATNWVMWKSSLWNFDKVFLLGSGWGSRHRLFYESQYVQILAETGVAGFTVFLIFLASLIRKGTEAYRSASGNQKRLALGWLLGFIGLLVHSFSCVSLTVAKIAIPFWFLTGFVFSHAAKDVSH